MGNVESTNSNDDLVDSLVQLRSITQRNIERAIRLVNYIKFIPPRDRRNARVPTRILHQPGGQFYPGALHMSTIDVYAQVLDLLRLRKGQTFLNVGSGSGFLSTVVGILIGDTGVNHGIELYQNLLDYAENNMDIWARKKCASSVGWTRPELKLGDIYDPELWRHHQKHYDRIYIGFIIRDKNVLCRVIRMLRIGGILLVPGNRCIIRYTRTSETNANCETIVGIAFGESIRLSEDQRPPTPIFESSQSLVHISRQDIRRQFREEAYTPRVRRYINASIRVPIGGFPSPPPEPTYDRFLDRDRNWIANIERHVQRIQDQIDQEEPRERRLPELDEVTDAFVSGRRAEFADRLNQESALLRDGLSASELLLNRDRRSNAPAHLVLPPDRNPRRQRSNRDNRMSRRVPTVERTLPLEGLETDFIVLTESGSDTTEPSIHSQLSPRSPSYSPSVSSISSTRSHPESDDVMDEESNNTEENSNHGNGNEPTLMETFDTELMELDLRQATNSMAFPHLTDFHHTAQEMSDGSTTELPIIPALRDDVFSWASLPRWRQDTPPGGPDDYPVHPFANLNPPESDSDSNSDGDDLHPQDQRDGNPQREGTHQLPRCEYVNFLISRPTGINPESVAPATQPRPEAATQTPSTPSTQTAPLFRRGAFQRFLEAKRAQNRLKKLKNRKAEVDSLRLSRGNANGISQMPPEDPSVKKEEIESTSEQTQDQEMPDDVPGSSGAYPFGNGGTLGGRNQGPSSCSSSDVSMKRQDKKAEGEEEEEEKEECVPGSSGAYPLGNGGTLKRPEASANDDSKFKRPFDSPPNKTKRRLGFGERLIAMFSKRNNLKRNASGTPVTGQRETRVVTVEELAQKNAVHRRELEALRERSRIEEHEARMNRRRMIRQRHQEMQRETERRTRRILASIETDTRNLSAYERTNPQRQMELQHRFFRELTRQAPAQTRWEETFTPTDRSTRFQNISQHMAMAISEYEGVLDHDDQDLNRFRRLAQRETPRQPEMDSEISINFTFENYQHAPINGNITGDEEDEEEERNQPSTSSGDIDRLSVTEVLRAYQEAESSDDEDANESEEINYQPGFDPIEMQFFPARYRLPQVSRHLPPRPRELLQRRLERNAFLRLANRNFHRRIEELHLPVSLRNYVKSSEAQVYLEPKK